MKANVLNDEIIYPIANSCDIFASLSVELNIYGHILSSNHSDDSRKK